MKTTFIHRSDIETTPEALYEWHAREGAFTRLSPPWDDVRLESDAPLVNGERVVISIPLAGPLRGQWVAEYRDVIPGRSFTDVQLRGPFRSWEHTHAMLKREGGAVLEDRIEYTLPFGLLGRLLVGPFVRRKLKRLFAHRHRVTKRESIRPRRDGMKILVTGSRGMVGRELSSLLGTGGHEVLAARRGDDVPEGSVAWNPESGFPDPSALEGVDAVVHLAGENIAGGRWTAARKQRIRDSRVIGTRKLCEALAALDNPPRTLVCASAVGFYGSRGDERLDESSASGEGFLAEVVRDWEAACEPARAAGIRVVNLRFGVILDPRDGALKKMLPPFKLGAGGILGNGKQFMPWIALADAARAVEHCLLNENCSGPINAVAPASPTNKEFTKALGRVLKRPTIFPMPAFMARIIFGEMAEELLLASTRAEPKALLASGFEHEHPELEGALAHMLDKS